jgi:hypothetical protein
MSGSGSVPDQFHHRLGVALPCNGLRVEDRIKAQEVVRAEFDRQCLDVLIDAFGPRGTGDGDDIVALPQDPG